MPKFIAKATICESHVVEFCIDASVEVEAESREAAEFLAEREIEKIESGSKDALQGLNSHLSEYWLEAFEVIENNQQMETKNDNRI